MGKEKDIKDCFHCGEPCLVTVVVNDKPFCCRGCSQVYLLLNEHNLCGYYDFETMPGLKAKGKFTSNRFAYLDDESVVEKLSNFRSEQQINVRFSLPQMHCASCIYLLENLHSIQKGIISCRVNFEKKEALLHYDPSKTSLRKVVELMAFIGYEPAINLDNIASSPKKAFDRSRIIQLGVAGFCFSNIMMLSFPEYFSGGDVGIKNLQATFTWIIFLLSIPVLLYSAQPIFISAWKGLRQGIINIDAPIALASIITFGRSYVEIITQSGAGYLDSGTGIIFFMLIGRWFQSKTYDAISFDRQYQSYFPLAVAVLREHIEEYIPVTKLKINDRIIIRNEEMIPADSILVEGFAQIDYSFVTGENEPVLKKEGDLIFAGGKQMGSALMLNVVKEPSQSYITQLWNNDVFGKAKHKEPSFIHPWSRYFTIVLFSIAALTAVYWSIIDPSKLWWAVTAVLIVACPCSLLLSATFTFGNMQRVFGRNKFYLKNASVIETLATVKHIVFDKTGTITQNGSSQIKYYGIPLNAEQQSQVRLAASQSAHPLSKALVDFLPISSTQKNQVEQCTETAGQGVLAVLNNIQIKLGSANFVANYNLNHENTKTAVHLSINDQYKGYFEITNQYRNGIEQMVSALKLADYKLHILSGDNDSEEKKLLSIFGTETILNFKTTPQEKLHYIQSLKANNEKVLMIGDGLNDAGALMEADCGIAVSNYAARFSPACDAIIDGGELNRLDSFLQYSKWNRKIILAGFILSILYNIVGISFAVQAKLSPLTAAILMPSSSISIILLAWGLSAWVARQCKVTGQHD